MMHDFVAGIGRTPKALLVVALAATLWLIGSIALRWGGAGRPRAGSRAIALRLRAPVACSTAWTRGRPRVGPPERGDERPRRAGAGSVDDSDRAGRALVGPHIAAEGRGGCGAPERAHLGGFAH